MPPRATGNVPVVSVMGRLTTWVRLVSVMVSSTSESETTDEPDTRSDAVSVSETMASVTELSGSETEPVIVNPSDALIPPVTSSFTPGKVVPTPTLPVPPGIRDRCSSAPVVRSVSAPDIVNVPVIVSPAFSTQISPSPPAISPRFVRASAAVTASVPPRSTVSVAVVSRMLRLVTWVILVSVISSSTSASDTTDDPDTRSEAVRVSEIMASVIELSGSETVPVTVRPSEARIPPATSSFTLGDEVPTPTMPPERTSWSVPATRPSAGKVSLSVMVSPAFSTHTSPSPPAISPRFVLAAAASVRSERLLLLAALACSRLPRSLCIEANSVSTSVVPNKKASASTVPITVSCDDGTSVPIPTWPSLVMISRLVFAVLNTMNPAPSASLSASIPVVPLFTTPPASATPVKSDPSPIKWVALTVPTTSTVAPGRVVPIPTFPMVTMSWLPKSGPIFVPAMAAAALISASVMVPSAMWRPLTAPVARSSPLMVPSSMRPSAPPETVSKTANSPSPRLSRASPAAVAPVPPCATPTTLFTLAALPAMSPVTFAPETLPIYWSATGSPCQVPEMTMPAESTENVPSPAPWMIGWPVLPTVNAAWGSVVPIPTYPV